MRPCPSQEDGRADLFGLGQTLADPHADHAALLLADARHDRGQEFARVTGAVDAEVDRRPTAAPLAGQFQQASEVGQRARKSVELRDHQHLCVTRSQEFEGTSDTRPVDVFARLSRVIDELTLPPLRLASARVVGP